MHVCLSHHSGGYHTAGRATQETATGSGGGHEEHLGSKVQGTVSLLEQPHVPAIDSTHCHCHYNCHDSDSDRITRSPAILANIDTSTTVLLRLSTHLSVCLSVCHIQEVSMSVRLSVCVYAYLSVFLSVSLSLSHIDVLNVLTHPRSLKSTRRRGRG